MKILKLMAIVALVGCESSALANYTYTPTPGSPQYGYTQEHEAAGQLKTGGINRDRERDLANINAQIDLIRKAVNAGPTGYATAKSMLIALKTDVKTISGCTPGASQTRISMAIEDITLSLDSGNIRDALDGIDRLRFKIDQCK